MPSRSSEPLLVRVDPETRTTLVHVATSSDRTLSQLVRYATLWWIANPDRTCPVPGVGGSAAGEGFINVRFDPADMDQIRRVAEEMSLERGAVIRCAVRAWIAEGDFTALGNPQHAISTATATPTPATPASAIAV